MEGVCERLRQGETNAYLLKEADHSNSMLIALRQNGLLILFTVRKPPQKTIADIDSERSKSLFALPEGTSNLVATRSAIVIYELCFVCVDVIIFELLRPPTFVMSRLSW